MGLGTHRVEPLAKHHDRSQFCCGSVVLDRYLKQQARQDADKHVAAPFVLVCADHPKVLGYYALSASIIGLADIAPEHAKKLPRYPQLPVTLIGRLAVDLTCKGQGHGEWLLMDALQRSLNHADQIAAMAVVVDAKDAAAEAFYRHFDFQPLQDTPRRLYLSMKTIAALLG